MTKRLVKDKKSFYLWLLPLFFLLGSCATPTPYQQANYLGYGYRSSKLDNQNARVSFKGNKITERSDVELMLLYRAAELTVENGFAHFVLGGIETDRQSQTELMTTQVPVFRVDRSGRSQFYPNGALTPVGPFWQVAPGTITFDQFEAVSFIKMYKKPVPEKSFDAKQVLKNLKPQIRFPD